MPKQEDPKPLGFLRDTEFLSSLKVMFSDGKITNYALPKSLYEIRSQLTIPVETTLVPSVNTRLKLPRLETPVYLTNKFGE